MSKKDKKKSALFMNPNNIFGRAIISDPKDDFNRDDYEWVITKLDWRYQEVELSNDCISITRKLKEVVVRMDVTSDIKWIGGQ